MNNMFYFNVSNNNKNHNVINRRNNIKNNNKKENTEVKIEAQPSVDLIGLNYNKDDSNKIIPELIDIFDNNLSVYNEYDHSFCFIIASHNNENNIVKNLESVIKQKYKKWRCIYINDNSSDKTEELFYKIIKDNNVEDRFTYIKNDKQMYQSYCKYTAYQMLDDFEIVCLLDGDDWLYNENVLEKLNYYYNIYKVKIITSNFIIYHNGKNNPGYHFTEDSIYSDIDKKYNTIRYICEWKFRHLKTGLGILFKSIPDTYLKYENNWLNRSTDLAEMYCVSEFSNGSIKQVKDIFYVYNKDNSVLYPNSYYREHESDIRIKINNHIRTLEPCLYELPQSFIINLKRDTNHKINMIRQMKYISHHNYKFIEAVDGNNSNDVNIIFDKYKTYFKNNKQFQVIKNKRSIYNNKKIHCTKPAIGLLKSAEKICNLLKDKNFQHILILEDDIYTLKNFNEYLYINNKLLKDKDLIYMGCSINGSIYNEINKNIVFNNINNINCKDMLIYGTYAMIFSKKLIDYLVESDFVEFCLKANLSWDLYLNYLRLHSQEKDRFNFYIYYKQLFIPDVCKDGIQAKRGIEYYTARKINLDEYNL